jgi:hypothetical protein
MHVWHSKIERLNKQCALSWTSNSSTLLSKEEEAAAAAAQL